MKRSDLHEVRAYAPASVANVGCGFDVLGFAINEPGDEVVARYCDQPGVHLKAIHGTTAPLPLEAEKNTASVAVIALMNALNDESVPGIELELYKKMPIGSGLGSSAASAVAAVVAVNHLLNSPFSRMELLPFAVAGEHISSGASHADNAAASLLGGFALIRSNKPLDVIKLPCPKELYCTVIHPQIEIKTSDTRKILRKNVLLSDAVTQWGNVGGLVAGLYTNDYELIGRSLHDSVVEPVRSILIPGYSEIKEAAMKAGALGCSISGSGPSIFALSKSEKIANRVGDFMKEAIQEIGLPYDLYISLINKHGSLILEQKKDKHKDLTF